MCDAESPLGTPERVRPPQVSRFTHIQGVQGDHLPMWVKTLGLTPRLPRRARSIALRLLLRNQAVIGRLPEWTAIYGDGRVFVSPAQDRMYASVLCNGVWEPVESAALRSLLRPGDFAVDVGANHGWHTIGMGAVVGATGKVWAFEPLPRVVTALERNVSLNPGASITVFPWALGASPGSITMHVFAGLPEGHASASDLGRLDSRRVEAPRHTLDDVLEDESERPTLIKVDVEGSDLEVLRGASALASAAEAPMWLLEVNWEVSRACGYEPPDLLDFLMGRGDYLAYRLTRNGAIPEVEPRTAPHATAWLAVPRARLDRVSALPLLGD